MRVRNVTVLFYEMIKVSWQFLTIKTDVLTLISDSKTGNFVWKIVARMKPIYTISDWISSYTNLFTGGNYFYVTSVQFRYISR